MIAVTPPDLPRISAVLRHALELRSTPLELQRAVALLGALARHEHALELRLTMNLAWLRTRDPVELGYSSFGALCRENVDWGRSWTSALLRLVASPLDVVKRAACDGTLPLRDAVRAPGRVDVEGQERWLAAVSAGMDPQRDEPGALVTVDGEEAVVVRDARRLGGVLMGRTATRKEVDAYILDAWRARTPAQVLLEAARTPPEPPPPSEALDWSWYENPAADVVLGPWSEPRSSREALARVERIQAVLRGSRPLIARSWAILRDEGTWACLGYPSAGRFAEEVLGVSVRAGQRLARAGRMLQSHPEIEAAIRAGLPFGTAYELAPVLDAHNAADWVEIAARVGRGELGLAVDEARAGSERKVRARYRAAIAAADAWRAEATAAGHPVHPAANVDATPAGHEGVEGPGAAPRGVPLRVALPHREPSAPATPLRAPADLVEAARWLLAHVQIPPCTGFAAVKTRDGHRCRNPECRRPSLCNQAHHILFRSAGGEDCPHNGITLCRACHLRAVHAGRITVERIVVAGCAALLWQYPGRAILEFEEVPDH